MISDGPVDPHCRAWSVFSSSARFSLVVQVGVQGPIGVRNLSPMLHAFMHFLLFPTNVRRHHPRSKGIGFSTMLLGNFLLLHLLPFFRGVRRPVPRTFSCLVAILSTLKIDAKESSVFHNITPSIHHNVRFERFIKVYFHTHLSIFATDGVSGADIHLYGISNGVPHPHECAFFKHLYRKCSERDSY